MRLAASRAHFAAPPLSTQSLKLAVSAARRFAAGPEADQALAVRTISHALQVLERELTAPAEIAPAGPLEGVFEVVSGLEFSLRGGALQPIASASLVDQARRLMMRLRDALGYGELAQAFRWR